MRRLKLAGVLGLALVIGYPAWLGLSIWSQSHKDELQAADAIVVLGAAHYNGEPSPVFQARLDHAAYLYREGFSSLIIVTGGRAPGDSVSEAQAGRSYLSAADVPLEDMLAERQGSTTLESLRAVRQIADDREIRSILVVSDPLHSERIKRIASDLGFEDVHSSPASYLQLNRSRATKARELLREIGSLLAYELTHL